MRFCRTTGTCFCGPSAMAIWRPSCNASRSPMCGAGNSTGAMSGWVMFTKVATNRSRWRATNISGSWPGMLNATPSVPIWSCERTSGAGRACGDAFMAPQMSDRCWRHGRSICRQTGSRRSIEATTRRNWKYFASVSSAVVPMGVPNGKKELPGASALSQRTGRPGAHER